MDNVGRDVNLTANVHSMCYKVITNVVWVMVEKAVKIRDHTHISLRKI